MPRSSEINTAANSPSARMLSTAFKNYGVKTKSTSQYANDMAYLDQVLPVLSAVEAV